MKLLLRLLFLSSVFLSSPPVAVNAAESQCPFQLEIWESNAFTGISLGGGGACGASPDSVSMIYANSACHANDENDGPGNYRAMCNDDGQFVFTESGCSYSDCRAPYNDDDNGRSSSCQTRTYSSKKLPQSYASLHLDDTNNTLDLEAGVNNVGTCYQLSVDDGSVFAEEVHYRITGDCNCTWAPTTSPAPTPNPSAKPTVLEFEFQGPAVVKCTREEDECDFRGGSRCSNLNWKSIQEAEDSQFSPPFGSEGIVTFQMTSEDCQATCTEGCTVTGTTRSGAGGGVSYIYSLLLIAGLSVVMALVGTTA